MEAVKQEQAQNRHCWACTNKQCTAQKAVSFECHTRIEKTCYWAAQHNKVHNLDSKADSNSNYRHLSHLHGGLLNQFLGTTRNYLEPDTLSSLVSAQPVACADIHRELGLCNQWQWLELDVTSPQARRLGDFRWALQNKLIHKWAFSTLGSPLSGLLITQFIGYHLQTQIKFCAAQTVRPLLCSKWHPTGI